MFKVLTVFIALIPFSLMAYDTPAITQYLHIINQTTGVIDKMSKREKTNPSVYCPAKYNEAIRYWYRDSKRDGEYLRTVAQLEKAPTKEEILNPASEHFFQHETVRKSHKHIKTAWHLSGPSFPHTSSTCKRYFKEELKIVKFNGKFCREVKFSDPKRYGMEYYQMYCEGDKQLYLNFHPANHPLKDSKDCINCM